MICKVCRDAADVLTVRMYRAKMADQPQPDISDVKNQHLRFCEGPTHCDCQHKVKLQVQGKAVKR